MAPVLAGQRTNAALCVTVTESLSYTGVVDTWQSITDTGPYRTRSTLDTLRYVEFTRPGPAKWPSLHCRVPESTYFDCLATA